MNEFLKLEYAQCLDLLKYYDERHHSLMKYAASLSSAVPSVLFAFYQLGSNTSEHFWKFAALISGMTTIGLSIIFISMIQNRLYFIYPVRQVNAIRKEMLESPDNTFKNNQMYLTTEFSAFKWKSTQSLLNAFVALQFGILFGFTLFSIFATILKLVFLIPLCLLLSLLVSTAAYFISASHLIKKSKYHPDQSVHNQNPGKGNDTKNSDS